MQSACAILSCWVSKTCTFAWLGVNCWVSNYITSSLSGLGYRLANITVTLVSLSPQNPLPTMTPPLKDRNQVQTLNCLRMKDPPPLRTQWTPMMINLTTWLPNVTNNLYKMADLHELWRWLVYVCIMHNIVIAIVLSSCGPRYTPLHVIVHSTTIILQSVYKYLYKWLHFSSQGRDMP